MIGRIKTMKSLLKKIFAFVLICAVLLTGFVGCSSTGKTLMELEDTEMSVNLFMLLLSRMKGKLASSYAYGTQALKDSFWDTVTDAATGETYNDYYTDMVLDNAKTYLAALQLFDELGLKLPNEYTDEIDEELEKLIESDANGSKSAFNALLAEYGANYKVLREAYIMEAKISYLNDYLFGADGSKISDALIEDYYQSTYVRFKHIFFFTTKPVYDTDANGDTVYYTESGKIAYSSTGEGVHKREENGAVVRDSNGDIIWETSDGKISYDKKNGTPNPVLDSDGNVITTKLSSSEMIALSDKVQLIMEDEAREGEYKLFDALVEKYGEDEGMEAYPNGYYLTATSDYDSTEVRDVLFEMEEGEIKRVESDYGIHIVMKYELDKGGYSDSENADFFMTDSGSYTFLSSLKSTLLDEYLEKYKADIKLDEDRLSGVSMKSVGANYNY